MKSQAEQRSLLVGGTRRWVVKLGSNLLAPEGRDVRRERLAALAAQVAALSREGREVVLVSSGAIASGMRMLGLKRRPEAIDEKQALAAMGQPELMRAYGEAFGAEGLKTAQVLLIQDDFQERRRSQRARAALEAVLKRGVVPVINENDAVAVEEIRMGDNDVLSAMVALLLSADLLVILTDVDGLYTGRPGKDAGARKLDTVESVTPALRKAAGGSGSEVGSGGMATKLAAAERVTRAGRAAVIASGEDPKVLLRLARGEAVGTLFLPAGEKMPSVKRWLSSLHRCAGSITVDAGARAALVERGRSLLPSGITRVSGGFGEGEAVSILDPAGREFARGAAQYSAEELGRIKGLNAKEIAGVLGSSRGDEAVHRDNLLILEE